MGRGAAIGLSAAVVILGGAAGGESAGGTKTENGRIEFVSSWAENLASEVYGVDLASGRRTNLSRNPALDSGAVVSPDGGTILFLSVRDNLASIWAMNADGSGQRPLAPGETPIWSPDGARIAFSRGADVMTMAADGTDVRRLAKGQWPAWSPDGRTLAWVDGSSVFTGSSDGSSARRLYSTTAVYSSPTWAPDGTQVAVAAEVLLASGSVFHGIVTIPVAGGEVRRLAGVRLSDSPAEIRPTWSPDGTRIAYVGGRQILAVLVDDGTAVPLTRPPQEIADTRPAWSPNGRFLAFARGVPSASRQLFVVPAWGGKARQVTHEDAHSWLGPTDFVVWTPDGRSLVYSNQMIDNDSDIYTVNPNGSVSRTASSTSPARHGRRRDSQSATVPTPGGQVKELRAARVSL